MWNEYILITLINNWSSVIKLNIVILHLLILQSWNKNIVLKIMPAAIFIISRIDPDPFVPQHYWPFTIHKLDNGSIWAHVTHLSQCNEVWKPTPEPTIITQHSPTNILSNINNLLNRTLPRSEPGDYYRSGLGVSGTSWDWNEGRWWNPPPPQKKPTKQKRVWIQRQVVNKD